MGHDISALNKAGEEIAYARFSMGNRNATILYSILNANNYYAGVSGTGHIATFTIQQIEKAWNAYKKMYNQDESFSDSLGWDDKQITEFLINCLATAKKEERVNVYFG